MKKLPQIAPWYAANFLTVIFPCFLYFSPSTFEKARDRERHSLRWPFLFDDVPGFARLVPVVLN